MFLAVLIALPIAAPVGAAEPTAPPAVEPSVDPTPIPDPTPVPDPTSAPASTPVPSVEPAPVDVATTPAATQPEPGASRPAGAPDPTGRWIVMLKKGADTTAAVAKARKRDGVKADRTYGRALRGFAASLNAKQRRDLLADPNVAAIVPDGIVHVTQSVPTGVSRVGGLRSPAAAINGVDQRVDADVAIVDTGIAYHPDLNVAGGYNCSTSDRTAWRDKENHGTHVAGTVGALDNAIGVVGVAPGARVWAVKILNDDGYGLISWYICGLDWILAQRDPVDSSRPLFEAVNMSVAKAGSDDRNCGLSNNDPLHQAICRVVAGGITVVAAAANESHNAAKDIPASYDEVITVSALADTDGKPGGLGGDRCYSWGGYDKDDTFADFSNYGADVDIMAPGKCIMSTVPGGGYRYMSGTSMAAPTVTGAVALYKSTRPNATPADVKEALRYLGNLNWKTSTDPDPYHEPLLDVSRISALGTFALKPTARNVEAGTTVLVPVTISRSTTFFERVQFKLTSVPAGWTAVAPPSLLGWTANTGNLSISIPAGTPLGAYEIELQATNQGRVQTMTIPVQVVEDDPTAFPSIAVPIAGSRLEATSVPVRVRWPAATDPTSPIAGYQLQVSVNGAAFGGTVDLGATRLDITRSLSLETWYRFRVRARDTAGHWSAWSVGPATKMHPVDDRSSSIVRRGAWSRSSPTSAWRRTVSGSSTTGASMSLRFTGRAIAFVAPKNAYRGKAQIFIDGTYVTTISLKSSTQQSRNLAFVRTFSTSATHTIRVRVVGGGTYPNVRVDAFVIWR